LDEYDQLSQLYNDAWDRIQSGGTGAGWSGIHYDLMNAVRRYGKTPNSREDALRMLKKLLAEIETEYFGKQSDEEYLSQFDDQDE
jgi:hypothetical protein